MKTLRMAPFAAWMYVNLRHLSPFKKVIDRARAEEDFETEREAILDATKTWGDTCAKKTGLNLIVEGNTDLPSGPVVFVSNHQGYGDILAYCVAIRDKQFGFVAKNDLHQIPVFGRWIERVRSVFIERDDARASLRAIETGINYLKDGFSLAIFPEGTRSKGDEMEEFKKGSLRLATKAGVPVIPVTLSGTWHLYEENGCIQPTDARFYFHNPIYTEGMPKKEMNDLAARVEEIIREKLDEYNSKI